ncbi:MAG: hypothetical protein BroJett022_15580 [Actinomycetes bacterium]|nr:MAG: hypothetical protein BroJett022_15580 [Actinomycetes bacterium]
MAYMPGVPTDPGQLLRAARKRHGVKQAELAERLFVDQSKISRIERGARSPSVAFLEEALAVLGEELVLDTKGKPARGKKRGNILYDPR